MTGKVGIGMVVLHDREDVVMIAPYENVVALYKLRSPKEIRKIREVPQLGETSIKKEELRLARSLVDSMSTTMSKIDLTDKYHDALRSIIDAKVAGKEVVTVEEEERPVVDIMTALKQSIERAKLPRKPAEKASGRKNVVSIKEAKKKMRTAV